MKIRKDVSEMKRVGIRKRPPLYTFKDRTKSRKKANTCRTPYHQPLKMYYDGLRYPERDTPTGQLGRFVRRLATVVRTDVHQPWSTEFFLR
jgi:hypothetical protein